MSDRTTLPISRGEWVEFASREWCEEANRYLQEQAALHPDALDGVEWSVTERWQNAPPHLGFDGNVAGFWFTISGSQIEVGPARQRKPIPRSTATTTPSCRSAGRSTAATRRFRRGRSASMDISHATSQSK